ncbi:Copia protein [Lucilia cuprina]|nr:Copia protein [Lucilia cuprina]
MGDQRKEIPHGIVQFNGTGYENWSFRVKMYLDALDVLEAVESSLPENATEAQIRKYMKKDKKAKSVLVSCISDNYLEYVRDKSTSKAMWNALKDVFAVKSSTSQTIIRKQLARLKLSDDTKMKDHFIEFDSLVRQLKSAGAELAECDLVSQLFAVEVTATEKSAVYQPKQNNI